MAPAQSTQGQKQSPARESTATAPGQDAHEQQSTTQRDNTQNKSQTDANKPPYQSGHEQQTVPERLGRSSDTVSDLEDVREVQQALSSLMYNPGTANGIMTAQTQQAVREFQWLNDLRVTGTLDKDTKSAILSQSHGGAFNALPKSSSPRKGLQTPDATSGHDTPSPTESEKDFHHPNGPAAEQSSTTQRDTETKPNKDAAERASKAAAVLQDLTAAADKKIPNELLERAEAIAVIPNMIKGAFGIGGRYGKGVVAQRSDSGRWSSPSFIEIGGGSFGAQIGVTSTDLVLVFTDRKALSLLDGGKDLKLGADAGVAAGPVGRSAEAGVNANLDTAIYSYSRSKGLFAGVSLDGAVLSIDRDMNEKVYGAKTQTEKILSGDVAANTTVRPFTDALEKYIPKKRLSQK